MVRSGFYGSYDGAYISATYVCTVAMIALSSGLLMLYRFHKSTLEM